MPCRPAAVPEKLTELYAALGPRIHLGKEPNERATHEAALAEVGLPMELADAGDTNANDKALREEQAKVTAAVGDEVGTPVIRVGDQSLFGPVMSPAPKGEEAGGLWDGWSTSSPTRASSSSSGRGRWTRILIDPRPGRARGGAAAGRPTRPRPVGTSSRWRSWR